MYVDPLETLLDAYGKLGAGEDGRAALDALRDALAAVDRQLPAGTRPEALAYLATDLARRQSMERGVETQANPPLAIAGEGICCNPDLPSLKRLGKPLSPGSATGLAVTMNQ